ncbi:MAG TPA: hypothetical protein VGO62_02100 [Myxococcota bacterium]|jgi:hypothetical protein
MRSLFALVVAAGLTSSLAAFAEEPAKPLSARVAADADAVSSKGEHAVQFTTSAIALSPVAAKALKGKRVTWTLFVKRKLAGWDAARNYPLGESLVKGDAMSDVTSSLLFVTLARDGFLPGEHEAAVVGTVDGGKSEVFRGESSFLLKPGAFVPVHRSRR